MLRNCKLNYGRFILFIVEARVFRPRGWPDPYYKTPNKSSDSSVGIVTASALDGWGSIPAQKNGFLSITATRSAVRPIQPPLQ
jgi:hypothetical protein